MGRVGSCASAIGITIDPIIYSSTSKRLNTNGYYCSYDSTYNTCDTDAVIYNSTAKRLASYLETVNYGGYCSSLDLVSYDSTNKRLTHKTTIKAPCD